MPLSKREEENLRALCAQAHEDDGVDPREDKRQDMNRTKQHDRKLEQLCKQVANALQLILPSVNQLSDVTVSSVRPAPNAGRLRVTVTIPETNDHEQVAIQLEACGGYIRSEMAQAVSRRRVPDLAFWIVMEDTRDV